MSVNSWSRSPISGNYEVVTQVTAIMLSVTDKVSVPVACKKEKLHALGEVYNVEIA